MMIIPFSVFQAIFVIGDKGMIVLLSWTYENRFEFTYFKKEDGKIYQSIEKLDKEGMGLIEKHDVK